MISKRGNAKIATLLIAGAVSLGIFGYMQLTTTTVYVCDGVITAGTQITEDLLSDGTIIAKSVPKSLTNEGSIKNFNDVKGEFAKYPIGPGKMLFSYDIAGETDIRNNPIIRNQNLEALTLKIDSVIGASDALRANDRVNVYTIQEVDLSKYTEDSFVEVGKLPDNIKELFITLGDFSETDKVATGEYQYSKLLAQNIPVIDVVADLESSVSTDFVIGVTADMTESILLAMKTGSIGMNILPYSENGYKIKESKGSIQYIQVAKESEIIKDTK